MTSRRRFLQTGLAGGLLLGVAGCGAPAGKEEGRRAVVAALAPVILAGALPTAADVRAKAVAATVEGVDQAIAGLAPATQEEIGQLFVLLAFAPTRVLVAGVWPAWDIALPGEIAAFLESWRNSRFALLRSGYAGLHDLILGAWYAQAESWPAIGYPGPPNLR